MKAKKKQVKEKVWKPIATSPEFMDTMKKLTFEFFMSNRVVEPKSYFDYTMGRALAVLLEGGFIKLTPKTILKTKVTKKPNGKKKN